MPMTLKLLASRVLVLIVLFGHRLRVNVLFHMFRGRNRTRLYCEDCHPLTMPGINEFQVCKCEFYDFFVGERWLRLPCFFVEEANVHEERNCRIYAYDGQAVDFSL